jgi:hypothetical protein
MGQDIAASCFSCLLYILVASLFVLSFYTLDILSVLVPNYNLVYGTVLSHMVGLFFKREINPFQGFILKRATHHKMGIRTCMSQAALSSFISHY